MKPQPLKKVLYGYANQFHFNDEVIKKEAVDAAFEWLKQQLCFSVNSDKCNGCIICKNVDEARGMVARE